MSSAQTQARNLVGVKHQINIAENVLSCVAGEEVGQILSFYCQSHTAKLKCTFFHNTFFGSGGLLIHWLLPGIAAELL